MEEERKGKESHGRNGRVMERGIWLSYSHPLGKFQRGIAALEFLLDSPNLEYSM